MSLLAIAALVIISLLVLVVGGTQAAPPSSGVARPAFAQVILDPTAMAWVSSVEPDTNFGGLGYAWVGYGQGAGAACCSTLRGLVKFDLSGIPADALVTDARLYATIWGAQGPPDHFMYWAGRAMDQIAHWTEEGVTWSNAPNATYGLSGVDLSATFGQVSWDVTSQVQGMVDGRWVNNGFYLMRENDTTDPQEHTRMFGLIALVVNYETATPTPTPTPQPLVQITKSDQADPVYAGDEVVYTISVRNVTDHSLSDLWLEDTIPGGAIFVEATSGGVFEDGAVIWEIPSLYPGASYVVDLTLRTSSTAPEGTVLANRAVVSYACGQAREVAIICTQEATETTTVLRRPTPTPTTAAVCPPDEGGHNFNTATDLPLGPGGITAYICPAGDEDWFKFPVDAGDIIDGLLCNLPADYAAQLWRPDGVHQATYDEDGLADERILWWGIEPWEAGEWRVRVFSAKGAYSTEPYSLMMQVYAPTPTPTRTPTPTGTPLPTRTPTRTPTPTPTATPRPSMSIEKQVTSGTVYAGQDVTYEIEVTNTGQVRVNNVEVWDYIPPHTTFVSASDEGAYADDIVTWPAWDHLNSGATLTYQLTLHVSDEVPDGYPMTNRAYAQADEMSYFVLTEHRVPVSNPPRLQISKRALDAWARAGEVLHYEIIVSNQGSGSAYNVQVWDEIPQITEGVGSTPPGDYDPDTQTVTWPVVDTLPPGEELVFTPGVRVPSDAVHNRHITNRAYAQADGVDAVSASVNSTIWNPPDLTVAHIEVNQAVQDRENSVPLVARKPAVARVYVDIGDQGETVGHVTGILEVWRDGTLVDTITPSNPRGEIAAPDDPDPENINDSLNFILDSDYLFDDLVLEVTLNPDHTVTETDYNNNTETLHATFTSRRSVRIAYVPIHYDPPGYVGPNDPSDRIAQGDQFYKWIYPLAPRRVDYFPLPPITWTQDVNIDYTPLILEVGDLWFDCDCDHVYGWLPSGVFGSNGLGYKPGYTAYGNDTDDRWRRTFAHELGHNMDADHPRGQGGDPNAPDTLEEGEEYGFNVSSREVKSRRPDGGMLRDVMYAAEIEPNAWVTPYFWNMMFDAYGPPTQAVAESAPGEYLLASGIVHRQGGGSLRPLFRVTRTTAPPPEGTDYCLRQEDAIGQSLALHCFDVGFVGDDAPTSPDTMPFHIIVPWADGTARVVLLQDTTVLDERVASPSSPTVQVLSPNGGESWSGAQAVSWTGSDPDGDTLVYSVLYSHDGGASWQPVSPRITTTTYLLDTSQVGGGDQCLIGVRVSDGLNTAHDESDAVFQVATKPPQAFIYAPEEDEASLTKGRRASFAGRGHDLEDGLLPAGSLSWSSSLDGFLGTGYSLVTADLSLGTHQITLTATDSQSLTGTTDITIQVSPPPSTACVERLHNGGFETGNLAGWHRGGTPRAVVINSQPYTGAYSLLLGNPAELPEQPSLSFVRQYVRVPADASEATLTFWYKVHSSDPRVDYDWFGAYILDPQGDRAHQVVRFAANTDWEQAIYDLTEFRGQVIGIGFFVRNDGQSGSTWAFVDDVSVCTDGAAPPAPELDACWLPGDQPDYAPAGLPDFGQRQGQWLVPDTEQWSHDGPAAMANLLWWQDSAEEPGATPPPTFSDGYPLVKSYGVWDDHDPQNVPPLVADLATRFNTNGEHPGTDLDDLVAGLNAYLAEKGLADDYTLTLRKSPSFDWVREEAKQNRQALLLLGFWELQPTGWRRLGGHYVAVAGASCSGDWIAFSDPFRNYAEAGWPGRVAPTTPHGHPAEPPDAVHNDAAYLSHDIYGIMRTTAGWGPQGYARWYQDVDNFAGLNFVPALEPVRAAAYLGGEILTLADYALVLAPQSELVTLKLSPTTSHVRAGQSFLVEMEVLAGAQDADAVSAYLNFDPAVLTVVDEEGSPATQITPGAALPTVTTNSVNNTTGWINFVAGGDPTDGRFTVATVRFKAITTTMSSPLTWSMAGLRQSDLSSSGDSVLGSLQDGSVTVGPGAFLVGQAEMQGRSTPPDASWSVPLLLTLSRPGERGAAYVYGTMSNESGVFPVPGVAAPGNYRVRVKGLHTLRNLSPTALSGGANTADMETLLEGDAINDNRVDVRDVSAVAAAYGKSQGQAGFDPRADFNEDDTINDADVSLLQANLGRRGDVLVGTHVSRFTLHEITPETFNLELTTSPQAGAVSLRLVPTSTVAAVGDVIVLDVVADAGAQPVDAAELHLDFDPAALQVVDAAGDPATEIEPSIALPTVFLNSVDPARGWADYLASSLGSSPASGEFTVARLRFKVLQAGGTWVRFSFSDWRLTDMTYQAQSVLGSVEAAQVQATAKYDIYLPVILKQYNP